MQGPRKAKQPKIQLFIAAIRRILVDGGNLYNLSLGVLHLGRHLNLLSKETLYLR